MKLQLLLVLLLAISTTSCQSMQWKTIQMNDNNLADGEDAVYTVKENELKIQQLKFENKNQVISYIFQNTLKDDITQYLLAVQLPTLNKFLQVKAMIGDKQLELTKLDSTSRSSQNLWKMTSSKLSTDYCTAATKECNIKIDFSLDQSVTEFKAGEVLALLQFYRQHKETEPLGDIQIVRYQGGVLEQQKSDAFDFFSVSQSFFLSKVEKYEYQITLPKSTKKRFAYAVQNDLQKDMSLYIVSKIHKDNEKITVPSIQGSQNLDVNLMDGCQETSCLYDIAVYVQNTEQKAGAFFIGILEEIQGDGETKEQNMVLASNFAKNQIVLNREIVSDKIVAGIETLDLKFQYSKSAQADELGQYTVSYIKENQFMKQSYTDGDSIYLIDNFATTSILNDRYYVFVNIGKGVKDATGKLESNLNKDRFFKAKSENVITMQFTKENAQDFIIYENIVQTKDKVENVEKFSIEFVYKKEESEVDNLEIKYEIAVQKFQGGAPIPVTELNEMEVRKASIPYVATYDLSKQEECTKAPGCSVILRVSGNNSNQLKGSLTAMFLPFKEQLAVGKTIDFALSDKIKSQYFEGEIDMESAFKTLSINGQNFEKEVIKTEISINGQSYSLEKKLTPDNYMGQQIDKISKDELKNLCKELKKCIITLKISAENTTSFKLPVTGNIQLMTIQDGSKSGYQEWSSLLLTSPQTKAVCQAYTNSQDIDYQVFHAKQTAKKDEQLLLNLFQGINQESKFITTYTKFDGEDGNEKYPTLTEEDMKAQFQNVANTRTTRNLFAKCESNMCTYLITIYMQNVDKSKADQNNSIYLEVQNFQTSTISLAFDGESDSQTNPHQNSVMAVLKTQLSEDGEERQRQLDSNMYLKVHEYDGSANNQKGFYIVQALTPENKYMEIDQFKTGKAIGIIKPYETYYIFYYSEPLNQVPFHARYIGDGTKGIFKELEESKPVQMTFKVDYPEYFMHHTATSDEIMSTQVAFSVKQGDADTASLKNIKTQVSIYKDATVSNQIFPTDSVKSAPEGTLTGNTYNVKFDNVNGQQKLAVKDSVLLFRFSYEVESGRKDKIFDVTLREEIEKQVTLVNGQFEGITFKNSLQKTIAQFTFDPSSIGGIYINFQSPSKNTKMNIDLIVGKEPKQSFVLDDSFYTATGRLTKTLYQKNSQALLTETCSKSKQCTVKMTFTPQEAHINDLELDSNLGYVQIVTSQKEIESGCFVLGPIQLTENIVDLEAISLPYGKSTIEKTKFLFYAQAKSADKEKFVYATATSEDNNKIIMEVSEPLQNMPTISDYPVVELVDSISASTELKTDTYQKMLNQCEGDLCYYAISVYIFNEKQLDNRHFMVGLTQSLVLKSEEDLTAKILKNSYLNLVEYKVEDEKQQIVNIDIKPTQAGVKQGMYDVLFLKKGDQKLQQNISKIATYEVSSLSTAPFQYATVSATPGQYFIVYSYGHLDNEVQAKISFVKFEDRFIPMIKSQSYSFKFNSEAQDYILFYNIKNLAQYEVKSFEVLIAKDGEISSDQLYFNEMTKPLVIGDPLPIFDNTKNKLFSEQDAAQNKNGVVTVQQNVDEMEACKNDCTVYIKFGYNKKFEFIGDSHIFIKIDVGEKYKDNLYNGNFKKISLNNYFRSDILEYTFNPQKKNFGTLQVSGQNFEIENLDVKYRVKKDGKIVSDGNEKELVKGNNASSIVYQWNQSDFTDGEMCGSSTNCMVELTVAKKAGQVEFQKSITATIQFTNFLQKADGDSDKIQVFSPVHIPYKPLLYQAFIPTVSQAYNYNTESKLKFLEFHFKTECDQNDRLVVNLVQSKFVEGAKFLIQGELYDPKDNKDGEEEVYPSLTKDELNTAFDNQYDMNSQRFLLNTCVVTGGCYYRLTVYMAIPSSTPTNANSNSNSFYIESKDVKNSYKVLDNNNPGEGDSNPELNSVMFNYQINPTESQNFQILLTEQKSSVVKSTHHAPNQVLNERRRNLQTDQFTKGKYVVCFYDESVKKGSENLRVIDTFEAGQTIAILKPLKQYYVFYYANSVTPVKYTMQYLDQAKQNIQQMVENKASPIPFAIDTPYYYQHFQIKHVTTDEIDVQFTLDQDPTFKNEIESVKYSLVTYGKSQQNNVFPSPKNGENYAKTLLGDQKNRKWKINNLSLGCSLDCNMLFKFSYSTSKLSQTPIKVNATVKEIRSSEIKEDGPNVGLIVGLSVGGAVLLGIAIFLFIRCKKRNSSSGMNESSLSTKNDIEIQNK